MTPAFDIDRPETKTMSLKFIGERVIRRQHKKNENSKQQKKMTKEAGSSKEAEKKHDLSLEKLEPLRGVWQTFGLKMGEIHFLVDEEDATGCFLKKTPDSERKPIEVKSLSKKEFEAMWKIDKDHSVTLFRP